MARKKNLITAQHLYNFELITDFRISPDGKHVIYSLQRVEKKTEKKYSNLWLVPTSRGAPRQFTQGDHSDSHPRWSPDGSEIAFFSNRDDEKQPQIYIIPLAGGEARKLTDLKGQPMMFQWSPDGKSVVLMFRKKDKEVIEREKDEQKKKLGVVDRVYDRPLYKLDGSGYLPKERAHIWIINAKSGKARQLTDSDVFDEVDPIFTPDGKHILFNSNRSKEPDITIYEDQLYLIPAKGGKLKEIPSYHGQKFLASISPDGRWVAFYGNEGEGRWWRNLRLWIAPVKGKGKAKCLTDKYDFTIGCDTINDVIGALGTMRPEWSKDGKSIYFQASWHGNTVLKKIDIDTREIEDILTGDGAVGNFCFDETQNRLCYYHGDMESIGQIFVKDMDKGKDKPALRQLTKHNQNILDRLDLGDVEEFWFRGADGNDLQGWIIKPPGFDARRKYPSILEIHGGPWVQYGNLFMHEFFYFASKGYVVCFCNPRGGQGYGEKHAAAIDNSWGDRDFADVMKFAGLITRKRYIDKDRMGVTGGSYGGYMTNMIIGRTDKFKAAVTQRSVSNFISMWGSSDFNWTFQEVLANKPPWDDLNNFWKQSPMKYMGNAKTPTMVIHSEMDKRCEIEQGEQVFIALKTLGVDTEMVRFPDEPHGLSRGGRTDRRIARLNHMLRWFDKYLKGRKKK